VHSQTIWHIAQESTTKEEGLLNGWERRLRVRKRRGSRLAKYED